MTNKYDNDQDLKDKHDEFHHDPGVNSDDFNGFSIDGSASSSILKMAANASVANFSFGAQAGRIFANADAVHWNAQLAGVSLNTVAVPLSQSFEWGHRAARKRTTEYSSWHGSGGSPFTPSPEWNGKFDLPFPFDTKDSHIAPIKYEASRYEDVRRIKSKLESEIRAGFNKVEYKKGNTFSFSKGIDVAASDQIKVALEYGKSIKLRSADSYEFHSGKTFKANAEKKTEVVGGILAFGVDSSKTFHHVVSSVQGKAIEKVIDGVRKAQTAAAVSASIDKDIDLAKDQMDDALEKAAAKLLLTRDSFGVFLPSEKPGASSGNLDKNAEELEKESSETFRKIQGKANGPRIYATPTSIVLAVGETALEITESGILFSKNGGAGIDLFTHVHNAGGVTTGVPIPNKKIATRQ